jgi:hemolysin activation/secretion protein
MNIKNRDNLKRVWFAGYLMTTLLFGSQMAHALDLKASSDKIFVQQFQLSGNMRFSTQELKALIHDYQNREITPEELQAAKNILAQHYIDHGYLNAAVTIPDQTVTNGVILLSIVEEYHDINNRVFRHDALIKRLQTLPQNPLCEPIADRIRPSFHLVEENSQIMLTETRPYLFNFNLNNHRSPNLGAYRGEISFVHHNLLGQNDVINLCYGLSEGIKDYSIDYSIPLLNSGTTLSINFAQSDASVIEYPFNQLEVESEAENISLSLRHLFYQSNQQYLMFFSELQKFSTKTFLLGRPFSFSPGVQNGESQITRLKMGHQWTWLNRDRLISTYSSFNFGLDALDSTINEDGSPDSQFFSVLGAFAWTEYLPTLESRLSFWTAIHYTDDSLLSSAKSAIGGADTVRGYRENYLIRDSIFLASVEWQVPITRWRIPNVSREPEDGLVYLIPFIDYGRGQNADNQNDENDEEIFSVGLGWRWYLSETIQAELFWGHALTDIPEQQEYNLQDDGIHFELSFQLF